MRAVGQQVADAAPDERQILVPECFNAAVHIGDERLGIHKRLRRRLNRVEHTETNDVERHSLCIQQQPSRDLQVRRHHIHAGEQVKDGLLRQGIMDDVRVGDRPDRRNFHEHRGAVLIEHTGESAGCRIGGNRTVATGGIVLYLVPGFTRSR